MRLLQSLTVLRQGKALEHTPTAEHTLSALRSHLSLLVPLGKALRTIVLSGAQEFVVDRLLVLGFFVRPLLHVRSLYHDPQCYQLLASCVGLVICLLDICSRMALVR